MGTLYFGITSDEIELLKRKRRGERLSPDEESSAKLLIELENLNEFFAEPADTQHSVDGYGVRDWSKL